MRLLKRLLRAADRALGVLRLVDRLRYSDADNRLPRVLAVALTYGFAAYVILLNAVRMGLKILQRKRVPSFDIPATVYRAIQSMWC